MPRASAPKGIHAVKAKGKQYRYAWRGGPRLFAEPGTPAFEAEYAAALDQDKPAGGTYQALADAFLSSGEFATLAPRTRADLRTYVDMSAARFGVASLAAMEDRRMRAKVKAWRDSMAATPRKADLAIEALRRVLNFGIDQGEIQFNVAARIKPLHSADRSAEVWSDNEIAAFCDALNPAARRAFLFMRWTGLRRSDACAITWSADQGSHLEWRTGKSRGRTMVIIPVLPQLRALIDQMPRGNAVTMLANTKGRSWTPDGLSTALQKAKVKTGITKRGHDVRGTFATDLMLAGLDDREIAEIMGWRERDVAKIRRIYVNREAHLRATVIRLQNKP